MFSTTAEYALRILGHLAAAPAEARNVEQIALAVGIPHSYTAKVLQRLRAGGFLESTRGRGGGFRLARRPAAVRLLDVVDHLDDGTGFDGCLLGQTTCSDRDACPLHTYWSRARALRDSMLHCVTLADLGHGGAVAMAAVGAPSRRGERA